MEIFKNDDSVYLTWHAAHPNAFVLNHFGGTNPAYNVMHRSKCVFLWRVCDEGSRTVVEKWCSESESELSNHADLVLGSEMWKKCGVCLRSTPRETLLTPLQESSLISGSQETGEVWIAGEPAVWLGSGEIEWKQHCTAVLARNIPDQKPQWIDIVFRLPQAKLFTKDIDNLVTPVLESARDAGWVERGFANLGSITAIKMGVADPKLAGAEITAHTEPPSLITNRIGILVELPLTGLNADNVKWALYDRCYELFNRRPELRYPPQYPISAEIRVFVSNASRRKSLQALMKPSIDGMEPLLGHPDNLLPEPRANLRRRLAPQDEMVMALEFHVRGGELDEIAVLLCPFEKHINGT
jgi:hypothetical protein